MPYIDDIKEIWKMVLTSLKSDMIESAVELWFGSVEVADYDSKTDTIVLSIASEFKYKIISENYLPLIQKYFLQLLPGCKVSLQLASEADAPAAAANLPKSEPLPEKEKPEIGTTMSSFNFEYTFENFIVGNSNRFAHAACVAVADRPAIEYNPLFIYGPSGLGKTHLLNAIINEIASKKPDIKVIYVKGDEFTNQLIDALSRQATKEFRDKYRNCDILLIDDIQFIAGKVSTQEEFFHTFNALYEDNKQIILTSDRPPKDIKTLEDRLKTRFEGGLIADIQPPDMELRVAIIKKKAEQINIHIPDDVLNFLAENLRSNIRQIEGAIKKLGAKSFLSGSEITMDLTKSCISELLGGAEPVSVTIDKIFTAVQQNYEVSKKDLVGPRRTSNIASARHIAIYLIRNITDMSFPNIGKIFERDHTTIMSSIGLIEKKIASDNTFALELENLKKQIVGDGYHS